MLYLYITDNFFLCQAVQHVYTVTDVFRIRWLIPIDNQDEDCNRYSIDYVDETSQDCILTDVHLQRIKGVGYELPSTEKEKILEDLIKALKGEISSDEEEEEEEEEDEEEDGEDEEEDDEGEEEDADEDKEDQRILHLYIDM